MRNDKERLLDIADAVKRIEKYAERGQSVFESDELIQNWIVTNLQVIGEAANHISPELKTANPEIAWPNIIGMRNILVHGYFQIDLDIVWSVVEKELPRLKKQIAAVLDTL